jgi:hypothetical protein
VQVSTTEPLTHEVEPVEAQAPTPQDVGVEMKSSSAVPLQSSSTPLHMASSTAGVPGVQLSTTAPLTQEVEPVEAHAPRPHAVGAGTKSSSVVPSQSSSAPLHVTSLAAGVPGVQLSTIDPLTQEVEPVAAHAPTPHAVGTEM